MEGQFGARAFENATPFASGEGVPARVTARAIGAVFDIAGRGSAPGVGVQRKGRARGLHGPDASEMSPRSIGRCWPDKSSISSLVPSSMAPCPPK